MMLAIADSVTSNAGLAGVLFAVNQHGGQDAEVGMGRCITVRVDQACALERR